MGIAKVTRNYQVTIPKDVRTIQDIAIGDTIVFSIEGDRVEILKLKENILEKSFGSWTKINKNAVEEVKELRKEWIEREKRFRRY